MGNHDEQIISDNPKNFWDKWAKEQLSPDQRKWISTFKDSLVLDGHILLIHGIYSADYDILPNTSDADIASAFRKVITDEIDQVWFGHYHYQIDREIDGIGYHCIRPAGHHRDKDTRAGYSVYENGCLTHKRVEYDVEKTVSDFNAMDIFEDAKRKQMFADLLRNAYHEQLLKKDIAQMAKNENKKAE